jgi:uncharacterized YigZ family protein
MTQDVDKYYTIKQAEVAEIKVKGSKFIANAAPANNKDDATTFLEQIRSKHFDATHNCFAYQFGWDRNEFRYSDDGEPSGTAGKPIYLTLGKYDVSDIIVVVTRYFGGTLLGVGGLIRAYSNAAEEVLQMCEKKVVNRTQKVKIFCRYEEISLIKRLVSEYAISFTEDYTDSITIIADIPISKAQAFADKISADTNARAKAEILQI